MAPKTISPKIVKKIVAPSAKEKAAPEFRTKVSLKNEPKTLMSGLLDSALTAQIFVAKSRIQTNQATPKSVRHMRTVSAVLPSACTACRELRVGKLEDVLCQLAHRTLHNFHTSYYQYALVRALFVKPCHVH